MRSFVLGLRAAGMANPQIVALTGVSLSTVKKLWTQAKDNGFVIDDVQLVADVSKLETALSPTKGSAIDNAPSKKRKAVSKKASSKARLGKTHTYTYL